MNRGSASSWQIVLMMAIIKDLWHTSLNLAASYLKVNSPGKKENQIVHFSFLVYDLSLKYCSSARHEDAVTVF